MFQITGKLKVKGESRQVSDSFTVREFVLTDDSTQYPQHIQFQLCQDKTSLLNGFVEGQELTVSFNLRGREWSNPQGEVKYFNTLDAWRVTKKESATATTANNEVMVDDGQDDSLPF